jgi:AraC-like DNA-binding protein
MGKSFPVPCKEFFFRLLANKLNPMSGHLFTYLLLVPGSILVLRLFKKAAASEYVQFLFFLWWVIYTSFHFTTGRYYLVSTVSGGAFLFLLVPLSYAYVRNQSGKQQGKQKPLHHLRTAIMNFVANFDRYMQNKIGFSSSATAKPDPRHSHSVVLTRERMCQIEERVTRHLEEKKPYLQRSYSLKMLSDETHIAVHHLSAFVNQYYKINFNDFINEYRVMTCVDKLLSMEWKYKKLEAIAEESGFNNRNTFTVAFRKVTGVNPSQFLKNVKFGTPQKPGSDAVVRKTAKASPAI